MGPAFVNLKTTPPPSECRVQTSSGTRAFSLGLSSPPRGEGRRGVLRAAWDAASLPSFLPGAGPWGPSAPPGGSARCGGRCPALYPPCGGGWLLEHSCLSLFRWQEGQ